MKIAVFHNLPNGGAQRVLFEEVKSLSEEHQLVIFTTSSKKTLFPFEKYASIRTFPFEERASKGLIQRILSDLSHIFSLAFHQSRIANNIDAENFDVCLVHPDKHTQAPYILRFLRTPSVYYCHELLRIAYEPELALVAPKSIFHFWYERVLRLIRKQIDCTNAQAATQIICNSNYIKKKIQDAYSREAVVAHPGVDPTIFYPRKVTKKHSLLFIGEPSTINGYQLLLSALELLPIDKRPKVEVLFSEKKKSFLSDSELAVKYSQSKATLCLGINEPFGLVSVESQACGTPVIALNEGGYTETVLNNAAGVLIEREVGQLANAIKTMTRSSLQSNPHQIANKFSWKKHHLIISKVLESCLK